MSGGDMYVRARPEEGISDANIRFLARLLHDTAINCHVHYAPRTFDPDQVHQVDALNLLRALRREAGPIRLTEGADAP